MDFVMAKETEHSVFERDENGIRKLDLEYGDFPDDGYDYSKHFAERGNGIFIQADGTVIQPEDRGTDEIEITNDIPEGIDPEILAMLNGENQQDGMDDDFVEKAMGKVVGKQERVKRKEDTEFEETLRMWDGDGDDLFDENISDDLDLEFEDSDEDDDLQDANEVDGLFKNGNPIDSFDMTKDFIDFNDSDVQLALNSVSIDSARKQRKMKLPKKEKKITKEDLEIDPAILLRHAQRVMLDEPEETETVVIQTVVKEDIIQHQDQTKPKGKPKNKPKMVKAPLKKKK